MLESFLIVPLHFTIEFAGLIVAAGAVVLITSRPGLIPASTFSRTSAAIGFAVLAGAQVAHGASFVEADGDERLIMARALGLALVAIGVSGAGKPYLVAAAVRIREPLIFAPAGAALALMLAALHGARRGVLNLRRLAFASLLLGVGEILTGVVPNEEIGTEPVDAVVYWAHGARLLGFVALAAWLWTAVRTSVRSRFVATFAGLLVAVVLALSSTLTGVIANNVKRQELERLETQLANAAQDIDESVAEISRRVQIIAQSQTVRVGLANGNNVPALAKNIVSSQIFGLQFAALTGHPRRQLLGWFGDGPRVIGRRGEPVPTRASVPERLKVLGTPVVEEVAEGDVEVAASIVVVSNRIGDDWLAVAAAARVADPQDASRTAGVIVVGRYIDALTAERISASFRPAAASILIGKRAIVTSLPRRLSLRGLLPGSIRSVLQAGSTQSREQTLGSRSFFSAFASLENASNMPVTLVLSIPAEESDTGQNVTRSLFLVALAVGAVALVLAWLSGRRITRPIQALTTAATEIREGNLETRAQVSGEDEVGELGQTFNQMTGALLALAEDLGDAARQERELRDRIETIIQSMADGLVAVDADKKVLAFNVEAEVLTAVPADEAIGKSVVDVLDVRDAQGEKVSLPVHTLGAGSVGGVYLMRRVGSPIAVAVTSAVLKDEDDVVMGGVAVVRDMSREHELERMKSEFLQNISHELRTPLTPIKGYAELLGSRELPSDKTKRFASGILESTERLERIVGLLVDFADVESGRVAPRSRPVDLGLLVDALAREWGARSEKHRVVADIDPKLPKVSGDERLLRRSIEEILDNAIKFSPEGGTIRLEARCPPDPTRDAPVVEVTVTDEGIGISSEDLPNVFADFRQADSSETRTYGGLGLGLAFVQRIVDAHRGDVAVESDETRGTRLTIRLPATKSG